MIVYSKQLSDSDIHYAECGTVLDEASTPWVLSQTPLLCRCYYHQGFREIQVVVH